MIFAACTPALALIISVKPKKIAAHSHKKCDLYNIANKVYADSAFKLNHDIMKASMLYGSFSHNNACFIESEAMR